MRYAGSYVRHTAHSYADIDIHVETAAPVTLVQRERIKRRLQDHQVLYDQESRNFGDAKVSLTQFGVHVSIRKIKRGCDEYGSDDYTVLFLNRDIAWGIDDPHCSASFPSLRGSSDRLRAHDELLKFFGSNEGAQHVARLVKYSTYSLTHRMPGVLIDSFVQRVAELCGHSKADCTEFQHCLYRDVVDHFSLGSSSDVLRDVRDDERDRTRPTESSAAEMVRAMSKFYSDEWNREHVLVKHEPARPWTDWSYLGSEVVIVPGSSDGMAAALPNPWVDL